MSVLSTKDHDCSATSCIVFVTDRWGYERGGINAFNTDACSALAEFLSTRQIRVVCAVQSATQSNVDDAKEKGIKLVALDPTGESAALGAFRAHELIATVKSEVCLPVKWWFGHDVVSGELAAKASKLSPGSKSAVFHHMNYEAYKGFSSDPESLQEKVLKQRDVLLGADIVFGIGPKLTQSAKDKTSGKGPLQQVVELVPGLPEIEGVEAPGLFSAITFGRISPATDLIKQASLAVAAFSAVKDSANSPLGMDARLTVIGLSGKSSDSEHQQLLRVAQQYGNRAVPINAFPYNDDRHQLFDALRHHSVCMMLSFHEGFGLTGWEAVAAEVPLIVSTNSGLYETIDQLAAGLGTGCIYPVEIRGQIGDRAFHEDDLQIVLTAISKVAKDSVRAKNNARALKKLLSGICTWRQAAITIAVACDIDHQADAPAGPHSLKWSPHKLIDALVHSKKNIVEQVARRHIMFDQLWTSLQAPRKVHKRIVLFGGIATSLCDSNAARCYADWLTANPEASIFICYETGDAAAARARTLSDDLNTESGLPAEPIARMQQKIERVELLPNAISENVSTGLQRDVLSRVHLVQLNEPLTTYILLTDDDIAITPLFEARSSESLSFSLSRENREYRIDILRFMLHHLNDIENSYPASLLVEELGRKVAQELQ